MAPKHPYQYSESLEVGGRPCFFLLAGAETQGSAPDGWALYRHAVLVLVPLSKDAKAVECGPRPSS